VPNEVRGGPGDNLGGIRHGETQGGPIAIQIANTEWPKWQTVMAADPVPPEELEGQARNAALTRPRPGHADLVGMQKYDFDESRRCWREQCSGDGGEGGAGTGRVRFLQQGWASACSVMLLSSVRLGRLPGVVPYSSGPCQHR
jgi:chorismate synthase